MQSFISYKYNKDLTLSTRVKNRNRCRSAVCELNLNFKCEAINA